MTSPPAQADWPAHWALYFRLCNCLAAVRLLLDEARPVLLDTQEPESPNEFYLEKAIRKQRGLTPEEWLALRPEFIVYGLLPVSCLLMAQSIFESHLREVLNLALQHLNRSMPVDGLGLHRLLHVASRELHFEVSEETREPFDEFVRVRNLWVHEGGQTSARYLRTTKSFFLAGHLRVVSFGDIEWALFVFDSVLRELAHHLDRYVFARGSSPNDA